MGWVHGLKCGRLKCGHRAATPLQGYQSAVRSGNSEYAGSSAIQVRKVWRAWMCGQTCPTHSAPQGRPRGAVKCGAWST
eukprot:366210-Chlamydomonas_euryale.AAC.2